MIRKEKLLFIFVCFNFLIFSDCTAEQKMVVNPKPPIKQAQMRGRLAVDVEQNVEYGQIGVAHLLLDIYLPEFHGKIRPAVVLVHGGGFEGGDKSDALHRIFSRHLAGLGYVVFNVNYRLAPEHLYPSGIDDVQLAVRWIKSKADVYQIDPERVGAIGRSAGAYYAAMLALRDTRMKDPELAQYSSRIKCAALYYGLYDHPPFLKMPYGKQQLIILVGEKDQKALMLWKEATPITYVTTNASPIYLFHGTDDQAVSVIQSRRFYKALKEKGAEVKYMELEGAGHGWRPRSDFGRRSEPELFKFLAHHLQP